MSAEPRPPTISVIVCAFNEAIALPACLHSLLSQTRPADEILVVDNASTDGTADVAAGIPGVRVVAEPQKGLVRARQRGYRSTTGGLLAYLDADCRAPIQWLASVERRFLTRGPELAAVTGPYRYYDWNVLGPLVIRMYDLIVAGPTHFLVHDLLRIGAILYGGNFSVRREALARIGGFDTTIAFHGEDANLGRRLLAAGDVELREDCWLHTSARRYRALGMGRVFRLYARNFTSEVLRHRPRDTDYVDVRD